MEKIKIHRPCAAQYPISSSYGERTHPVTGEKQKFHYGIDLAVPVGTPIVAALDGIIVKAGWENPDDHKQGFGYRVWQRTDQTFICYAHLSEIEVYVNYSVRAGERIGLSGNTGASSGPHLHLEVREGGISGKHGVDFEFIEKTDSV